jgi:Flp pilus assembly pilin Flp
MGKHIVRFVRNEAGATAMGYGLSATPSGWPRR